MGLGVSIGGLTACADIVYRWHIPDSQDDCATGTRFVNADRNSPDYDGGTGIVDRDGGTGIVDRNKEFVLQYCIHPCVGNEIPDGDPVIYLPNKNKYVEAKTRCPD